MQRFTGLKRQGLTGAAVWHEYQAVEADRLTVAWAQAAAEHGAVLANHVEALSLLTDKGKVLGARARDALSGREIEVAARVTVNAAGAAIDRLTAALGLPSR